MRQRQAAARPRPIYGTELIKYRIYMIDMDHEILTDINIRKGTLLGETVHKIRRKPVQLHIPVDLLHELDKAARALGMPRTRLILRALRRDLAAMMVHEVKKAEQQREEFLKAFGDWK